MTPRDILNTAYMCRCVPQHLFGRTQEKTLQARLSEDLIRLGKKSIFFRTSRARFFLREFFNDPEITAEFKKEYFATRRRIRIKNQHILTFDQWPNLEKTATFVCQKDLDFLFKNNLYKYIRFSDMTDFACSIPVCAYIVVHTDVEILSYQLGRLTEEYHPSRGFRSFGFGTAVKMEDGDLLYDAYHGIIGNAVNELAYTLGAPPGLTRRARYEGKIRLWGAYSPPVSPAPHFVRPILSYNIGDYASVGKHTLSANKLTWLTVEEASRTPNLDMVSEWLLCSGLLRSMIAK